MTTRETGSPLYSPVVHVRPPNDTRNSSLAMPTGVVCFYLKEKGYGFITPDDNSTDDNSTDVFVHHSGISAGTTLVQDDLVAYELLTRDDGCQKAINICLLEKPPPSPESEVGTKSRDSFAAPR